MEPSLRPRPSQDEKGRRCDAMCVVFKELHSKMRKELDIETTDLNSALFSKGLISESVLDKKNIETTLKAVREALENESVAEETFEGFTNVLRDITSKGHLAKAMLDNLQDKLKGERVYVRLQTTTGQVGSSVVTSYSTAGQFGGVMPSKSHTECGLSSQKMLPESAKTTLEDSAISDEEEFTTTPQQPTDRESTVRNHGVAPEASGTLPLRALEPQDSPELEEMIKRAKQGKRTSEDMIDRRDEEIKQLHSLCKEKDEKLDEVQLRLLSNKKHYTRQIEAVEEKKRQAEEKRRLAEEKKRQAEKKANMEREKAGKLQQELEQTEESIKMYIQEAADQKELAEKTEEKAKMAEEKAQELAKELEETKDETLKYKQEAADQKELAEQTEEKVTIAEERAKMAEEKAQELAKKLEKTEEETQQCKQEAKEHKKMAEQKEKEVQLAEEKVEELQQKLKEKEENAQKCTAEFEFCTELAKQNDEKVAQLLKKMTENEELYST